jgi:hypothetical protein
VAEAAMLRRLVLHLNYAAIRVIIASDNGQFLHAKTGVLQFLYGGFGFRVGFVDRHDGIIFSHHNLIVCLCVFEDIARDILGCGRTLFHGVFALYTDSSEKPSFSSTADGLVYPGTDHTALRRRAYVGVILCSMKAAA